MMTATIKLMCAACAGVAGFYQEVFSHSTDSVEVYCKRFTGIDGMTFRHVESAPLQAA